MQFDKLYVEHEAKVLSHWDRIDLMTLLRKQEESSDIVFDFMDGPPFPTGTLHLGHLSIGSGKSSILNYKRMKGYRCNNRLGYDCHGLPIESLIMTKLGLNTRAEILAYGIANFNTACKEEILRVSGSWEPIYKSIGRFCDFTNVYKTMDLSFMKSVWYVFGEIYKKGLIYRGSRVMPYSYKCQSSLSNFEAVSNVKEVSVETAYVKMTVIGLEDTHLVIWTTTPWTLPCNLAVAVNSELNYDFCFSTNGTLIVGSSSRVNLGIDDTDVVKTVKGKELVGLKYTRPYNYLDVPGFEPCVVHGDFVKEDKGLGTGLVHIAPGFGDDDAKVMEPFLSHVTLETLCPIDDEGRFLEIVDDFKGKLVFDCSKQILLQLKGRNLIIAIKSYVHRYPYCYRTETPLIQRVRTNYFLRVSAISDSLQEMNAKATWHPQVIGSGRFGSWIANPQDWCLGRERFFGTPLPLYISSDGETKCVTIEELSTLTGLEFTDIHQEFLPSELTIHEKVYARVPFVFDCWFESGCVPYGQYGYPYCSDEMKKKIEHEDYLSDFIMEGLDQTRGWFYTLLVISTLVSGKPPFKHVICNGLILDEYGKKFSKKNKNYVDTIELIKKYGADTLRLFLLNSGLAKAEELYFSEKHLVTFKNKLLPYFNAYKFFTEQFPGKYSLVKRSSGDIYFDNWILHRLNMLQEAVSNAMESYELSKAGFVLIDFIEYLTNWYIKLNAERFKVGESLNVLFTVLWKTNLLFAPFAPFMSEFFYLMLRNHADFATPESVHLLKWDEDVYTHDAHVDYIFSIVQTIVDTVRSCRQKSETHRNFQMPIASMNVYVHPDVWKDVEAALSFCDTALNIRDIYFHPLSGNVKYKCIPNMKAIGLTYGKKTQEIVDSLKSHMWEDGNTPVVPSSYYTVALVPVVPMASGENIVACDNLMVKLDFTITPSLEEYYQVRRIVTAIQASRKEHKLNKSHKLHVQLSELPGSDKYVGFVQSKLGCGILVGGPVPEGYNYTLTESGVQIYVWILKS